MATFELLAKIMTMLLDSETQFPIKVGYFANRNMFSVIFRLMPEIRHFYYAMLCRAWLCHSMSVVCLSVRPSAPADPNMGDLMQREHPQNWGAIGVGPGAQKNLQYLQNGAR